MVQESKNHAAREKERGSMVEVKYVTKKASKFHTTVKKIKFVRRNDTTGKRTSADS